VRERRGGSNSDIAVDIILQRFEMKGEKKKENLSSWHQTQWEGDGNYRMKVGEGHVAKGGDNTMAWEKLFPTSHVRL